MARSFTPKVLTANRLREGDAVWLTAAGTWSTTIAEAELFTDAVAAEGRLAEVRRSDLEVVGVYLADAEAGPDGPRPTHFREAFRTRGPSNYAHGKQQGTQEV